ncbi:hypothetical protein WA026_002991 [Henosepilachna vigintioctopunctata]|uniref:Rho-GAP domain-containing protein n=1 Tax=Henosepilachna vigintioctopunctata TaxID=420089 RepID=A0AAW1TNB9_9CUCU
MFMNDVHKKDEIKEIAIQDLRRMGVKYRRKKAKPTVQEVKKTLKCFKVDLSLLPTQLVTLSDGQQLVVPIVVHDLCSFILKKIDTEGLFRKEGSKSRQNEIKLSLNAGCRIEDDYHVIDVAGILKTFLRELPEPLIPVMFHEYFLRCTLLEKEKLEAVFLLCLLLPQAHLNTLAYLLRFFNAITRHSAQNKMTSLNMAIVIGPNIFPFPQDKSSFSTQHKIKKTCDLVQLLIENANKVGIIPEFIIDRVANTNTVEDFPIVDKKKKRRSGSLTRMFNGLKKMVGNKSDEVSPTIVTPDLLLTPSITRSVKKRKMETLGLSNKRKKDVISNLPEGKILKMPFTKISTPICENPNPKTDKRKNNQKSICTEKTSQGKDKKSQWYSKSKGSKNPKNENDENLRASRTSLGPRSIIERRWSAVSSAAAFRRNKKRNSYSGPQHNSDSNPVTYSKDNMEVENKDTSDDGFVKISKTEYEHIKNRVSAIERRISIEMDNVQSQVDAVKNDDANILDPVKGVQTAYEQTLVYTEPLSPTTDQLARRLSRELKIRRSNEHVVIRSPSARKIGTLRRRSRELERQNVKLTRNQSWHVGTNIAIPRVTLRRNRANSTERTPQITANLVTSDNVSTPNLSHRVLRSSISASGSIASLNMTGKTSFHSALSSNVDDTSAHWTSADRFLTTSKTPNNDGSASTGRPSIAKLRSQNAGMVLAKAKLFDNLVDSDNSNISNKSIKSNGKAKVTYKVGKVGNDVKLSQRIKNLRTDDKSTTKKTMSPRRNRLNLSQRQKLHAARQCVEGHRSRSIYGTTPEREVPFVIDKVLISPIKFTPCKTPVIKKPLMARSPKRLCKTPHINRSTPLKVFTPRCMEY